MVEVEFQGFRVLGVQGLGCWVGVSGFRMWIKVRAYKVQVLGFGGRI